MIYKSYTRIAYRVYAISPIKYDDNERSRLSGIGSRGNWFSRMSSKRV